MSPPKNPVIFLVTIFFVVSCGGVNQKTLALLSCVVGRLRPYPRCLGSYFPSFRSSLPPFPPSLPPSLPPFERFLSALVSRKVDGGITRKGNAQWCFQPQPTRRAAQTLRSDQNCHHTEVGRRLGAFPVPTTNFLDALQLALAAVRSSNVYMPKAWQSSSGRTPAFADT
jgi:hypothetical protein